MSQRPRLAGDGLLRLPETVGYSQEDFLRGRLSRDAVDPFDWTRDRLLLAESFARLDLTQRRVAQDWFESHGVVDAFDFVGPSAAIPDGDWLEGHADEFADHAGDIAAEQANVIWHLATLGRLSEQRDAKAWVPDWGRLVVRGPDGAMVVGGPDAGSALVSPGTIEVLRRQDHPEPRVRHELDEAERLLRATEGWPVVSVGDRGWWTSWDRRDEAAGDGLPDLPSDKAKVLGTSRELTVALERLLIAPYVARAVERRFDIALEPQEVDGRTRQVLVPREERVWRSILAPIYLQLFEALRRISEGEPGAAVCRECGRPFLVLDARRRFFCNARERFRNAQRERRRRLREDSAVDEEPVG